jgi:hypothetical protein
MFATVLTLGFAGVEAATGWWSGSLALLSDAGHMVTDAAALVIAALTGAIARRGPPRSTPMDLAARNLSRRWSTGCSCSRWWQLSSSKPYHGLRIHRRCMAKPLQRWHW